MGISTTGRCDLSISSQIEGEVPRVKITLIAILAGMAFLGVVMWHVQVLKSTQYRVSLDSQSIRRVRLPAYRGTIHDRNGVCLADNRPSYCIAVYIEELRLPGDGENTVKKVESVIGDLSKVLGIPPCVTRDDIRAHMNRRRPLPFLAWRDVSPAVLARWAEQSSEFAGVDVYVEPVREYPEDGLAAHVLGYLGRRHLEEEVDESYHFYLPEMEGKCGLEKLRNDQLAGKAGGALLRVDASNYKYGVVGRMEPTRGESVYLALDARIQRLVTNALAGVVGACVVMDPRNGDVLAMASSPGFDPNTFSTSVSGKDWRRLNTDPHRPLFNRACLGLYPPGSTFKPIVALAALESGSATPETVFNCPGYYSVGKARFHCWLRRGHGPLEMRKAIEQSCNSYFCALGVSCGAERIHAMATRLGLGSKTGIDLDLEMAGLIPNDAWKRRRYQDGWRTGDTCNMSIGQGAVLVTPLQMAMATSAIANGGLVFRPRLVLTGRDEGDLVRRMGWSASSLRVVRGGMYDVVMAETGTGKRARVDGLTMAGKTGTAEYGPSSARKKHTWMIAFAPFEHPSCAIAIVIENGLSGGRTAAPRVRSILSGAFGLDQPESASSAVPGGRT